MKYSPFFIMKKLKRLINKNWNIKYKTIDKNMTLIQLAEKIACDTENCSVDEAYQMYIDNPSLHLPGLIAFYIVDEMGLDPSKVNSNSTLQSIFEK